MPKITKWVGMGRKIITLTTDFGLEDPYVGVMKGVILGIAPDVALVDLCHQVPPQDVMAGAVALEAAAPHFPAGTIHLAVVDPGVGSARAAVAVQTENAWYVGPDNGLFTLALAADPVVRAVRLTNPVYQKRPVSATFQGRDIFSPAAGHLAAGVELSRLGEPSHVLATLPFPTPMQRNGGLEVHVIHVDRFGNLVTDLTSEQLVEWLESHPHGRCMFEVGSHTVPLARTFADVAVGEPVAYVGSGGRLEIAIRNGSAVAGLGLRSGASIRARIG